MTEEFLVILIAAIAGFMIFLTLVIVFMKAVRDIRAIFKARWRRKLEPGLLRFISSETEDVLPHFVDVPMKGTGHSAAVEFLLEHSEVVKGVALERITTALEAIGMVEEEIQRLRSRGWWHRAAAAENLGLARSRRAIDPLAMRLDDENHEVRLRAARALGQIRGMKAVRPLVRALAEPSRWSTLRVADILSTMGEDAAIELVRMYENLPPVSRLASLEILGRLRRPNTAWFLEGRLTDEDPDVRARAAHALGQIGDPAYAKGLIPLLEDPQWPVRAMAAKALGRLRAPEAVEPLAAGLSDREWWVRSNSAVALRGLGQRGANALLKQLDAPDIYARHQSALMLQEVGIIDEYAEMIGNAAKDGETSPQADQARSIMWKLLAMGQRGRIEELAKNHADSTVRNELSGILKASTAGSMGGVA